MNTYKKLATISILLNVLLVAILAIQSQKSTPSPSDIDLAVKYPLLAKRIFLENPNDIIINLSPLRSTIHDYVDETQTKDKTTISVYFEYLPSGGSISVNETEKYTIASLLKLPIAMGLMNSLDEKKTLKTPITIRKEHLDESYGDLWKEGAGTTKSIEFLLYKSLVESDNTAHQVLKSITPEIEVAKIFDKLDIPKIPDRDQLSISVKSYSSILRSLYFSSILSRDNSQYLLDILAKGSKRPYIPNGIQDDIQVAHKIGYFASEQILSDCGIVYVPKRSYMLCAMTKGFEESKAEEIIKTISSTTYEYIKTAK